MMRRQRFVVAALACGAVLAAGGAANAQDAGVTCKATGTGTSWSLGVTGASVPIGGFVAGFPGGKITALSFDGFPGQPDTTGLPSGTSNGLFAPIPSGRAIVIHVVTSTPPTGLFNVAFINQAQMGYGSVFECPFETIPMPVSAFNGDGSPEILLDSPGAGTFFVVQDFANRSRATVNRQVALVKPETVKVNEAGKVSVPLHATAAGKALLAQKSSFTAREKVTFKSIDGHSSSKTVQVTFKKR
ncbi:MAG: hypothetical protein Q7L55_08390 [Actinomycetota bacterium]|nr:hypothetical protein [Actinomycetota bacterium]